MRAVLLHVVGCETDGVPEIMSHQAGHHGVQVNHHQGCVRFRVEKHIVDFRVVMGHPKGKQAFLPQLGQAAGAVPDAHQPVIRFAGLRQASHGVGLGVGHKLLVTFGRIVEVRDGFMEAGGVKIGKKHLKFSESLPGVADNIRIICDVVGVGGNVIEQPPEAVLVQQVGFPVSRVMEMQHALLGSLGMDVFGDQVDIVHNLDGVLEHIGIHGLNNVGFALAFRLQEVDAVGFIDVSHLDFIKGLKIPLNAKRSANLLQFFFGGRIGCHWYIPLPCVFLRAAPLRARRAEESLAKPRGGLERLAGAHPVQ